MKIIDRYIATSVIQIMLLVLSVLLAIFTFFAFLDEVNLLGKGNYNFGSAMIYIVLSIPGLISQLLPLTALLGGVLGLGVLAGNSELTAMRSGGISLGRIVWSTMKIAIGLVLIGLVMSEWLAPLSDNFARTFRSVALSKQLSMEGKQGLWAREGKDVVNVRKILPGERLGDIFIYQINDKHELTKLEHARAAFHNDGNWILQDVTTSVFSGKGVSSTRTAELPWLTSLSPDLLNVVSVDPQTLSIIGLYQYIEYLKKNSLRTENYDQAFWSKISAPFVTCIMMLLSIPFVFGPLRSVGVGTRMLVGALVGIGFHLLNETANYVGLVFHLNTMISVIAPPLLALIVAVSLLSRIY